MQCSRFDITTYGESPTSWGSVLVYWSWTTSIFICGKLRRICRMCARWSFRFHCRGLVSNLDCSSQCNCRRTARYLERPRQIRKANVLRKKTLGEFRPQALPSDSFKEIQQRIDSWTVLENKTKSFVPVSTISMIDRGIITSYIIPSKNWAQAKSKLSYRLSGSLGLKMTVKSIERSQR